jgi:predicted HAD superfamily Cof-like phosphohydrolase
MNAEQRMVAEFHERVGLPRSERPAWPGGDVHRVRVALIEEELAEFRNAGEAENLLEIADALGDLLYVIYGAAVTYGVDLESVFREIHRSNMSKGGTCPTCRPDGKVSKGEHYQPPRIAEVLADQAARLAPTEAKPDPSPAAPQTRPLAGVAMPSAPSS